MIVELLICSILPSPSITYLPILTVKNLDATNNLVIADFTWASIALIFILPHPFVFGLQT
jgi:hypothetical protein